MIVPTPEAVLKWQSHRRSLRWMWWIYLVVAVGGGVWFVRNFSTGDPVMFALLLLIPLIALWQAWKTDRQIVATDKQMRQTAEPPTMPGHS